MAWREKILAFFTLLALSAGWTALLVLVPPLLCKSQIITLAQLQSSLNLAFQNGKVMDFNRILNPRQQSTLKAFPGKDLSDSFPAFTVLGRTADTNTFADGDIQRCFGTKTNITDRWLSVRLQAPGFRTDSGRLVACPLPDGTAGPCFVTLQERRDNLQSSPGGKYSKNYIFLQK
jgi:hypothetical protein